MATRTVSNAGGNWNAVGTWVGGVVPATGDDIAFTATSGNLNVNVASAALVGVNFTNYVGTITFNNLITTSGFLNLGTGGYTQTGANGITLSGTTTLTSGGVTWSRILNFSGTSSTYTFVGNWTSTGTVTFQGSGTTTLTNNTLNINGNLTQTTAGIYTGTTAIVFGGTGTWSNSSTGAIRNNVTINTPSTLTMSGNLYYDTGIFTYTAGTVVTTGSTLNVAAATTFNTGTFAWNNFTTTGTTYTITRSSNLNITGTLTLNHTGTLSFSGAFTFNPTGALVVSQGTTTIPNTLNITNATIVSSTANPILNTNTINISGNLTTTSSGNCSGTTSLVLTGTGTWSNSSSGTIKNNLTINAGANTITVSGTVRYDTGTLTYTSGTVTTTGSTLTIVTSTTFATNGMSWNNVTIGGSSNYTITLSNNLTMGGNFVFSTTGTSSVTLNGNTMNVGGNFTVSGNSVLTGTTALVLNGTGTWSHTSTGTIRNNTTVNTGGTLTISGNIYYDTRTLTYTLGTVVTTGSTLNIGANVTLNTNGITWNNINTTTASAITLGSNLTLTGTLSLGNGTTSFVLGGFNLISTNANLTMLGANATFTMPSNQTFKTLTITGTNATINTNTLTITENLTINNTVSGTTTIVYGGTGTWTSSGAGSIINNILTINTGGTLTISGTVYKGTGLFTYTAGTINDTTGTVAVQQLTLNLSGFTFRKLLVNNTITLSSNLNATTFGTWGANVTSFTLGGFSLNFTHLELGNISTTTLPTNWTAQNVDLITNGATVLTGNSITITGNLTQSGAGGYSGTTTFIYSVPALATGTWSRTNLAAISNNFTINSAGTINFTGGVIGGGIFTYTAGTFNCQVGSTLYIYTSTTINGAGIIWYNVTLGRPSVLNNQVPTITLNTQLICLGTLSIDASITTFLGTDGTFDTYGFVLGSDAITLRTTTLVSTKTYRVRQSFTSTQATNTNRILLKSSIGGSRAIFTVDNGSTIDVGFVNATDIDSSLGRTIYSYNGVFSNTLNWSLLPVDVTPTESSFTFIS